MSRKEAIEKLKVKTHIFKVGTFKSAIEPYLRNDMSPAAKEANEAWLSAYWDQYKNDVAQARGIDVMAFDETVTDFQNPVHARCFDDQAPVNRHSLSIVARPATA